MLEELTKRIRLKIRRKGTLQSILIMLERWKLIENLEVIESTFAYGNTEELLLSNGVKLYIDDTSGQALYFRKDGKIETFYFKISPWGWDIEPERYVISLDKCYQEVKYNSKVATICFKEDDIEKFLEKLNEIQEMDFSNCVGVEWHYNWEYYGKVYFSYPVVREKSGFYLREFIDLNH